MKKQYKIIFLSVLVTLICGCAKDLEQKPASSVTTVNFYRNDSDFKQGVSAVYNRLNQYPDRLMNLSETRSDNLYAISDGIREWQLINDFAPTITTAAVVSEAWTANYSGIYNANTVLDALSTKGANVSDATLRNRFEAESKFLRAFFYFDLIRWFGKVPIIDKPMSTEEIFAVPRSPVADVYNLIISDLEFAGQNLPEAYTTPDDIGRATKYAAQSLLALVYLTRSGPTYSIEGPGMASNEYGKAAELLNGVINSGKYSLLPKYADIFSYTNENNKEVIFDIQYMKGGSTAAYQSGASYPGVLVPDGWLSSQGVPYAGGGSTKEVSQNLLTSYSATDLRLAVAIQNGYTSGTSTDTRPFIRKYVDTKQFGTSRFDWPINFIVMRYADILMMKAECILHGSGGTQTEADGIVNQLRARAQAGAPFANVTLDQLMEERRKEFAGEGLRWHDLIREGMAVTTMNKWIAVEDSSHVINQVTPNALLYPVPQAEMDVKVGLYTQNPGY